MPLMHLMDRVDEFQDVKDKSDSMLDHGMPIGSKGQMSTAYQSQNFGQTSLRRPSDEVEEEVTCCFCIKLHRKKQHTKVDKPMSMDLDKAHGEGLSENLLNVN